MKEVRGWLFKEEASWLGSKEGLVQDAKPDRRSDQKEKIDTCEGQALCCTPPHDLRSMG